MTASAIEAVATWLPETTRTSAETRERLTWLNAGLRLPERIVERISGVERVHIADEAMQASDLGVEACRRLEERHPGSIANIDLLIFASATQDLIEPATAHIVAHKLGLTVPVFDVKNACNSVLVAIEVADALIRAGNYRRVLICTGEKPSVGTKWRVKTPAEAFRAFPGYTMSDAGAALILRAADGDEPSRILGTAAVARSEHWNVGTLAAGGTVDPDATFGRYFDMNGTALFDAFRAIPQSVWDELIQRSGVSVADAKVVGIHQVATAHFGAVREILRVRDDQLVPVIARHGNMASCGLPRQLEMAVDEGGLSRGDPVLLVGLAGGISAGTVGLRW